MAVETKPKRLFPRVAPASGEAAKAQIIVGAKAPAVTCRLVDYSRGGACLEVSPTVILPERFELLHGGVRKKSRVVWRRGMRVGVAF